MSSSSTESEPSRAAIEATSKPQSSEASPQHAAPALRLDHPILFFDGVCGLCNRFVDFVLLRDRHNVFRFAPLQGETARSHLEEADIKSLKSVVLIDERGESRQTTAVIHVLQKLGRGWKIAAGLLWLIPRPIRDLGYKLIARNRYRLFGKKDACRMPSPEERSRFLP